MSKPIVPLFVALLLCGAGVGSATAQDALLSELYGRGVHAFFAGNLEEAMTFLDEAATGNSDPRVFYFRGLVSAANGDSDAATADFAKGADLEANNQEQPYNIGRALQRVQGTTRLEIESIRRRARLERRKRELTKREIRYQKLQNAEKEVLVDPDRPSAPAPDPKESAPDSTDPFGAAGAAPGAAPGAGPAKTVDPAKPADNDPFAPANTPPPADNTPPPADNTPPPANDPFATPEKPAAGDGDGAAAKAAPKGAVGSLFRALGKATVGDVSKLKTPFGGGAAGASPFGDGEQGVNPFGPGEGKAPPAGGDPFAPGGAPKPAAPGADPGKPAAPAGDDPFAPKGGAAKPAAPGDDPFAPGKSAPPAGDDPFAPGKPAPPAGDDPFAPGKSVPPAGDDPFAPKGGAAKPAPPAGDDPFAPGKSDPNNDPFADDPPK